MLTSYIGNIYIFCGNFAPQNFALCNGAIMPIAENDALFNLIGTTYGGDGQTTFGLPDLQGRVPIHQGSGSGLGTYTIGQKAGTETITLTSAQMATHTHPFNVNSGNGTTGTPATTSFLGAVTNNSGGAVNVYSGGSPNATLGNGSVGIAGNSQPIDIRKPFLAVNYIISLFGIYPSPN